MLKIKRNKGILSASILLGLIGVVSLLLVILPKLQIADDSLTFAGAGELPATVATSSNPTVGTTATLVFATSTCASRIVTTVASPVMITFSDRIGQTPTGAFGHLQAASSTVSYDASEYGCGAIKMYGFVSSAITVSESR